MAYQRSIRSYVRRSYGTQTRPYRRYKPSYTRRSVFRKTVATGKGAIATLQNEITRLRRKVNVTKDIVQYKDTTNDTIGNLAGNACYNRPLAKFSYWLRTFGTAAEDELPNEARWMKTNIDMEIDNNGERNNVDYSMYIVTLTKFGQQELIDPATGLMVQPLVLDVHYTRRDDASTNAGFVFLNKKYFNVLKCRRLMTGILSGLTTEPQGLRKRMYFKFLWNKSKGFMIKNPSGNWKAKACPSYGSACPFILLFNNDSTADQSVLLKFTAIHTVEV